MSDLVGNPKDRFSRVVALMSLKIIMLNKYSSMTIGKDVHSSI